jgi:signal transduction histidine kinase
MDADTLAKATDPFFTTKRAGEGSGLGLSMVKGFAEQSGGQLRLENREGGGLRATLTLPSARADQQAQTMRRASSRAFR